MTLPDFGLIVTIIVGIIAIVAAIKNWGKEEKDNAVEIANIKKDVQAQATANKSLQDELRRENGHLQLALNKVDEKIATVQEKQMETHGIVNQILGIVSNSNKILNH